MKDTFAEALAFVWRPGFDPPSDGDHVTPGDPGGETNGGVTAATWGEAVEAGIVRGSLGHATIAQLTLILRGKFWGSTCDALPRGVDLLFFNGCMMSGGFRRLFQQCLGFMGSEDVDGWIGPVTLNAACRCDAATLINAASGAHYAYLAHLPIWSQFGGGWTVRLKAAQAAALALEKAPVG